MRKRIVKVMFLMAMLSSLSLAALDYDGWQQPFDRTDSGTVAVWHFDEGTGLNAAGGNPSSASAYNINFNIGGNPAATWISSQSGFGSALEFSGTAAQSLAWTNGGEFPELSLSNGGTVEMWFRADSLPSSEAVLAMTTAGNISWQLKLRNNGTLGYGYKDINGAWGTGFYGAGTVSTNQWHHVALTIDVAPSAPGATTGDMDVVIYLDGTLYREKIYEGVTLPATGSGITVGGFNQTSCLFDGAIDELRISSVNRTIPEPATIALLSLGTILLRRKRS